MSKQVMQYRIPRASPIRCLPLVYFLPEELFVGCPTLRKLPRCFREVIRSEAHIATIHSDSYLNEIMVTTARLVFPHFGLSGWVEDYTGYCPAWTLAYAVSAWAQALEKEIDWGLQNLFDLPVNAQIPFFDFAYVKEVMAQVVKRTIESENWQPILDLVREMPCDEDFEKRNSNIRKDFIRKWYHTRSKRVKMVSLEACLEDEKHSIHDLVADSTNIEESIASEDYYQRFKARLSAKDMEILELRAKGFTYEEIADKLGYKNHSGVIKRMRVIKNAYLQYEESQVQ